MERKLKRIILDLEELSEERYLNQEAEDEIKKAIRLLDSIRISSTEV